MQHNAISISSKAKHCSQAMQHLRSFCSADGAQAARMHVNGIMQMAAHVKNSAICANKAP